jgi:hypothetical protein
MGFCTECGARLEGTPKFCPECGKKLAEPSGIVNEAPVQEYNNIIPIPTSQPAINRHELGLKLEEVVDAIFKADGYSTQRRQRLKGIVRGYTNEIDIIAIRGNDKIAIECKNHISPVGISQVRDFAEKILDMGPEWRGVFVGYSDFTEDASEFAQCRNIEQLGHDEVMEKWFAVSVGRSGKQGEKLVIEQALPVNNDFLKATSLDLVNKEKVKISDVKLIFHPYIRYKYSFSRKWRDPTKEMHHFNDKGVVVVDLLNNEIMNPPVVKDMGSISKTLSQALTSKGAHESYLRKIVLHEVIDNQPLSELTKTIGEDYRITKLAIDYSKRDVNRTAIEYIIDKNSKRISYSVQSRDAFPDIRSIDFIPDRGDIALDTGEFVFVPKWFLHFNAFGTVFSREMLACSGKMLEDTIAHCPRHFKLGILEIKTKNIGVCEKCGSGFCKSHGRQCEVCKMWLCDNHSILCSSCKRSFCREHISKTCSVCKKEVCNDCIIVCPVCGLEYGKDHAVQCNTCGKIVCGSCARTSGILKRVTTCKRCQPK